ncbi:MAG: hypothetical protein QXE66_06605 [Desulfurococcaceae archaeon]
MGYSVSSAGVTIATVVVAGVVLLVVLPLISYALLLGASYLLLPASIICETAVPDCTVETRVYSTSYGNVTVNVTRLPPVSAVCVAGNLAQDILLIILALIARLEVMAVAFAIDLITLAYEHAE